MTTFKVRNSNTKTQDTRLSSIILFNKPFQVLSQFSDRDTTVAEPRKTLGNYLSAPNFRVAGRLDYDSEGLIILTDNGQLQQRISNPKYKLWKTYWVQVEGKINNTELNRLCSGIMLKDGLTRPAHARRINEPILWPRNPPIRHRTAVPESWLEISLQEGRNRQVRRMTAAVGFPTLRLIRISVGDWHIENLIPGEYRILDTAAKTAKKKSDRVVKHGINRASPLHKR